MHATIYVRLAVSIEDDKTIPLATLAEFITDQNIESILLEGIVESLDAASVEDTAADHDESSYFRPVEDVLSFDGQNRYQQDIAATSVDLATSLSYRDAADHGDGIQRLAITPPIAPKIKG